MSGAAIVAAGGIAAGFLLVRRFPALPSIAPAKIDAEASVVVPARNEAQNLPLLLASIPPTYEVIVVDDDSSDETAAIAAEWGARVLNAGPAEPGWVGKSWACQRGARNSSGETLVFVDADVRFARDGLRRIVASVQARGENTAVSVLPYHRCERMWESFSLFFHLLMAFGAAGFTRLGQPQLLGPLLVVPRALYEQAGGHAVVRGEVLEHLNFAQHIRQCGGGTAVWNADGALWTRMYPQGFRQLCEGWSKAFVSGAGKTPFAVLATSSLWLAGGASACGMLFTTHGPMRVLAIFCYAIFAAQAAWAGRQIGRYHWLGFMLYPVPLAFYFGIFMRSLWWKISGTKGSWRGRTV